MVRRFRFGDGAQSSTEGARILGFLDEQLRPGVELRVAQEYPSLFGAFPGGESLYLESGGRLASHAGTLVREFQHGEVRFKVGLIGSVTTAEAFRGQGMAKILLEEAVGELRRQGCVVAVLWSGQPDFYRLMGFYRVGREEDYRFDPAHLPEPDGEAVEYQPERHAHWIWRLYQRHDVRVDRSLEEQKALLRIPRVRTFVTERDGKVTSYLCVNKGADFTDYIHEWGGDFAELRRNLLWVQKRVFPHTALTLISPFHYRSDWVRPYADRAWDGVLGLVKLLDRSKLLAAYKDFLRREGVDVRWEGDQVVIGEEKFNLTSEEGVLRLVFGGEGALIHRALPFFLWGFDSI